MAVLGDWGLVGVGVRDLAAPPSPQTMHARTPSLSCPDGDTEPRESHVLSQSHTAN